MSRKRARPVKDIDCRKMTRQTWQQVDTGEHRDLEVGWWLLDHNNGDYPWNGPYSTKKEAMSARSGLLKFWKYYD